MIQGAAGKIFHWVLKAGKNPIPPVALDQEGDLLVLEKLKLVLKNSFRKFNLRLGERNREACLGENTKSLHLFWT